jgi:hypothetical protein
MSNRRRVNNPPGTYSDVQQLTPQQQLWKVLSFHETRLNNIESMIDVILRALPWEARLEATDIEKYRKVESKLEGIEKELGALKDESVTSEMMNNVERNIEDNVDNIVSTNSKNVLHGFGQNVEDAVVSDLSPVDYLRQEEIAEGRSNNISKHNVKPRQGNKRGKRVSLEINE